MFPLMFLALFSLYLRDSDWFTWCVLVLGRRAAGSAVRLDSDRIPVQVFR